ncbi:RAVE subunit 2/Rogdi [Entophlyctis helioformis]|nr:RAVE subunit 2/Rogdi [Entophlyctis helioformis]
MNGQSIIKGDLSLRFPHYNRGAVTKVVLNPSKPFILNQVMVAQNGLAMCVDILDDLLPSSSEDNRAGSALQQSSAASDPDDGPLDLDDVNDALREVLRYIGDARDSLETPDESLVFPQREPDAKCFNPDLPEDLVAEFTTKRTLLTTSVYALSFHQQGIPLHLQSKLLGKFKQYKLGIYKGKQIEIVDEVSVESASPRLAEAWSAMDHAESLSRDVLAKLAVHNRTL